MVVVVVEVLKDDDLEWFFEVESECLWVCDVVRMEKARRVSVSEGCKSERRVRCGEVRRRRRSRSLLRDLVTYGNMIIFFVFKFF